MKWCLAIAWLGVLLAACGERTTTAPGGCVDSWADCDGDASNGCEVALDRDESNCGACGVVCGDAQAHASCEDGQCQQVCFDGWADRDGDVANGCEHPTQGDPTPCEEVVTCPTLVDVSGDDCLVTTLLDDIDGRLIDMVYDGERLYVGRAGEYDPDGGPVVQPPSGGIRAIDATTGEVTVLLSDEWVGPLALGEGQLIWRSPLGQVRAMPKAGGPPSTLATGLAPGFRRLVFHEGWIYLGVTIDGAPPGDPTTYRLSAAGGTPEVVFSDPDDPPSALAVDDSGVYLGTNGGRVWRVTHDGSAAQTLYDGSLAVRALALDEASVWLGSENGAVVRVTKADGSIATWNLGSGFDTFDVHVDGSDVYAASLGLFQLDADAAPGTQPDLIQAADSLYAALATDAERIFWLAAPQKGAVYVAAR